MVTTLTTPAAIDGVVLQAVTGLPLYALILVLAVVLSVGPYMFAQRNDLGQAHSVGAGIAGIGLVFLLLVALQLAYGLI